MLQRIPVADMRVKAFIWK